MTGTTGECILIADYERVEYSEALDAVKKLQVLVKKKSPVIQKEKALLISLWNPGFAGLGGDRLRTDNKSKIVTQLIRWDQQLEEWNRKAVAPYYEAIQMLTVGVETDPKGDEMKKVLDDGGVALNNIVPLYSRDGDIGPLDDVRVRDNHVLWFYDRDRVPKLAAVHAKEAGELVCLEEIFNLLNSSASAS